MAGPLATVAAHVRRELEELLAVTEEIEVLQGEAFSIVARIEALRREVEGLAGRAVTPELISVMTRKLVAVRRSADAVRMHVHSRRDHPPHVYLNSLGKLAEFLDEELRLAIDHFADVERSNPSALRRSEHGQVINIRIEEGSEGGGVGDGGSAHSAS
ncbi:hypothetical protein [Streptomyces sp. PA5.6]|uniref:hypothetical protein n=1 Tax=Streptomyces sp. PA5.6 TaxID=3035651 RepID=UPI003904A691